MRRSRPSSRAGPPTTRNAAIARPTRKIFNCIVDDTALVAGVKRSTRNGIRQWVKHGQIRLFVPVHALEELSRQKGQNNRHGEDIRETLQWLDEATSKYPNVVTLQEPDETYEKWADVEKFAVPRTLFSEFNYDELDTAAPQLPVESFVNMDISNDHGKAEVSSEMSDVSRSASPISTKSMRSSVSALSPPTSPAKAPLSPVQSIYRTASRSGAPPSSGGVPQHIQALFSYILWRIHQEIDPVAALESFIFLCNDSNKMSFAKGFDIKTKRLEQLREAVSREDREYKNRQALLTREGQNVEVTKAQTEVDQPQDPAVHTSSPPTAPAAMLHTEKTNVLDPNAFGRGPKAVALVEQPSGAPKSPRLANPQPMRGSPRNGNARPVTPHGGGLGNARGSLRGAARGRGQFASSRGDFGTVNSGLSTNKMASNPQIDPDSFARPNSRGGFSGARGGSRKLWVPT